MPKMDGTGPAGKGTGTGRGQGCCKKNSTTENNPRQGKGFGKHLKSGGGKGRGNHQQRGA